MFNELAIEIVKCKKSLKQWASSKDTNASNVCPKILKKKKKRRRPTRHFSKST